MTIDEAIERLTEMADETWCEGYSDNANALDLGIQALRRLKRYRYSFPEQVYAKLAGETEKVRKGD